jgi:uncharacterized BrkB/YihY/UPF0761 family membrane protein
MSKRNGQEDTLVLDVVLVLFGLVVTILLLSMLPKIGFKHLFDVTPSGFRLRGIPAFLMIGVCMIMVFFSFKRIINRYKKKENDY